MIRFRPHLNVMILEDAYLLLCGLNRFYLLRKSVLSNESEHLKYIRGNGVFHVFSNSLSIVSRITECENVQEQHGNIRILTESPDLLFPRPFLIVSLVNLLLVVFQLLLLYFKQSSEHMLPCTTLGNPFEDSPEELPIRSRWLPIRRVACFPRWFVWALRAIQSVLAAVASLSAACSAH